MSSNIRTEEDKVMELDNEFRDLEDRVRNIEITSARTEDRVMEIKANLESLSESLKDHLEKDEAYYISVAELKIKDAQREKELELRKQELEGITSKLWSAIGGITLLLIGAVVQFIAEKMAK